MPKKIIALRVLFTTLLLCTYMMIFYFSSDNGEISSEKSKTTMYIIMDFINGDRQVSQEDIEIYEPLLRKLAHFGIYTISGIWSMCLMCTFYLNEKDRKDKMIVLENERNVFKSVLFGTLIGFAYACSDEIHQMFLDGRSGKAIDVVIDTMGVLNGVLIVLLIIFIATQTKKTIRDN